MYNFIIVSHATITFCNCSINSGVVGVMWKVTTSIKMNKAKSHIIAMICQLNIFSECYFSRNIAPVFLLTIHSIQSLMFSPQMILSMIYPSFKWWQGNVYTGLLWLFLCMLDRTSLLSVSMFCILKSTYIFIPPFPLWYIL